MKQLLVLAVVALLFAPVAIAEKGSSDKSGKDDPRSGTVPAAEDRSPGASGGGGPGAGRGRDDAPRDVGEGDDEDDSDGDGSDARDSGDDRRGRGRSGEDGARGKGPSGGRGADDSIGRFDVAPAGAVDGDYVDFRYSALAVENVTAGGLPLFSAAFDGGDGADAPSARSRGSRLDVEGDAFHLRAHDTPTAVFDVESEGGVRFTFPNGTVLTTPKGGRVEVAYEDGRTARLFGKDLAVVGDAVTADEDVTFILDAKKGRFDVHRTEIARAITHRHVGAEVTLGKPDETGKPVEDVVEFGNVTVKTLARKGNVTLILDGHGFDGRVIVVNVDPALFGANDTPNFDVRFDNGTIPRASNFTDAIDPDDDGLSAEYYVVHDQDGTQVILTIPHYSVHTLTLASLFEEVPPSIVVGLVASALVVGVGYAVLFRAPKRRG